MKNIAIIPARSGSKGLTDKNIKLLDGKPLISYSIEAAKKSGLFDVVMVSTDSRVYAQIAEDWGAEVPFLRSLEMSSDNAGSWDVVREVLDNYQKLGKTFDSVCLLQPTSPLREAEDIELAYEEFVKNHSKAVVAVCEMDHSPLWSNTLPSDRSLKGFLRHELLSKGRQKLDTYYRINGAIYIYRLNDYSHLDFQLYTDNCYAYIMPRERSIDIDTQLDFKMAEYILKG